jgi:diaminopimelate decarboxylase
MMSPFTYQNNELFAEDVSLSAIAREFGTPCYVYSRAYLEERFLEYTTALEGQDHLVCYAVKANSNIAVLNVLAKLGAGFDIVSTGELERVLAAGGKPERIVFSGVGKSTEEMRRALDVGIHCFNVESESELERLNGVAMAMGVKAPISIRVNPDVDAKTHPYISTGLKDNKFGIDIESAPSVYHTARAMSNITIKGVDCHIGSQLIDTSPFLDALDRVLKLVDLLAADGIKISHLDLGGGLGVRYRDEIAPSTADYIAAIRQRLNDRKVTLMFEPGRSITANAGVLLTKVEYLKLSEHKNFAIIDAAMNDMIRPALYSAWMDLLAVKPRQDGVLRHYDFVGPVCETGDFLAKDRELRIAEGDLLALASSGAYGFTMSSNYNSRGRAAEVMVDGDKAHQIRARETVTDLMRGESMLP